MSKYSDKTEKKSASNKDFISRAQSTTDKAAVKTKQTGRDEAEDLTNYAE